MADQVISLLEKAEDEKVYEILKQFNEKNVDTFSFPELEGPRRGRFWNVLLQKLRKPTAAGNTIICIETIRILSRDQTDLEEQINPELLTNMIKLAGLSTANNMQDYENSKDIDFKVSLEAQKCLFNLIFNSKSARRMCCTNGCLHGIMRRLKTYKDPNLPHEVKFFDMRMLFFLSALCADIRPQLCSEFHGVTYLIEVLDLELQNNCQGDNNQPPTLSDNSVELICEVLKSLFNLTIQVDKNNLDEEEESYTMRLVSVLHNILLCGAQSKEKLEGLHSHTVDLLTNMSGRCIGELLTPAADEASGGDLANEFNGYNTQAVAVLVDFLDQRLDRPVTLQPLRSLKESLTPILSCLCECCKTNRIIRKYCRLQILPPLRDVYNRPEEGNTIRNKLCRLLTNPITDVKELVADLLFVLCKEDCDRFVKYTGYGNAAGLLASRGLMLGGRGQPKVYSSESEDSETEEYKAAKDKINPVLGCYEEPRPNPMDGMSEEQKEYEAMKLVNMMEKLASSGIVKPMRVGDDGKPHPVEHIMELQRGMGFPCDPEDEPD